MSADPPSGAFTRLLTRLTILNLRDPVPDDVVDDLVTLLTFEHGNNPPAVVRDGHEGNALVWRGYVTGGLATLYEHMAPLVDRHDLSALIGDERLEVHVAAGEERVLIIGPLADAMPVDRRVWEQRLEHVMEPDDLAQWFVFERLTDDAARLLSTAEEDDAWAWSPPASLTEAPPGQVDYRLLRDATFHLVETYGPSGEVEDAVVECRPCASPWRTDFVAPCLDRALGAACVDRWRVAQWRWSANEVQGWALTADADVDVATVIHHLPPALRSWAIRRTEEAIAFLDTLAGHPVAPDAAAERDRLRRELDALT